MRTDRSRITKACYHETLNAVQGLEHDILRGLVPQPEHKRKTRITGWFDYERQLVPQAIDQTQLGLQIGNGATQQAH